MIGLVTSIICMYRYVFGNFNITESQGAALALAVIFEIIIEMGIAASIKAWIKK